MSAATAAPAAPPAATSAEDQKLLDPFAQVNHVKEELVNKKVIPKTTKWDETIWNGPIQFISKNSGAITSSVGSIAGKVSEVAGGAVHSAQESLNHGSGFHFPKIGGEQWRPRVEKKTKAQVGEWLQAQELGDYAKAFEAAQVDGVSLFGLYEIWSVDKLGFLKYAQESLQVTAPGHALRLGVKLEDLHSFMWRDDLEAKVQAAKAAEEKAAAEKAAAASAPQKSG